MTFSFYSFIWIIIIILLLVINWTTKKTVKQCKYKCINNLCLKFILCYKPIIARPPPEISFQKWEHLAFEMPSFRCLNYLNFPQHSHKHQHIFPTSLLESDCFGLPHKYLTNRLIKATHSFICMSSSVSWCSNRNSHADYIVHRRELIGLRRTGRHVLEICD